MSVRSDAASASNALALAAANSASVNATIDAAKSADSPLNEANTFNTVHPDHPLKRTLAVSIRASLNDLCLRKSKATWAPSAEALRNIFQTRSAAAPPRGSPPLPSPLACAASPSGSKFTDLSGSTQLSGAPPPLDPLLAAV